jgi:hypothetical protein
MLGIHFIKDKKIMIYEYKNGVGIPDKLHAEIIELRCSGSRISKIPATLVNLRGLYCANTDIKKIPATLVNLRRLYCSSTDIKELPATLINLRVLNCYYTDIKELPDTLVNLTKLCCRNTKIPGYTENYNGSGWDVLRFGKMLKIGCEVHSLAEWAKFSDRRINAMDSNALKFWKKHKSKLLEDK